MQTLHGKSQEISFAEVVLAELDVLGGLKKHGTHGRSIDPHSLLQAPTEVLKILSDRKIDDFIDKFSSR